MATGDFKGRGTRDRNVGDSAGIRPFKLDLAYETSALFLTAKGASGENSSSAEEGDWFYDSTLNVLRLYDGTAWRTVSNISAAMTAGQVVVANSSAVPTPVTLSGDVTVTSAGVTAIGATKVTQAMVATNALDGTVVANTANINVIGGIPVLFRLAVAGNTTVNVTMTHAVRVIDVWVVMTAAGGGAATMTVGSTGNAITDAMDINKIDTTVIRVGTINDANHEIPAAGVLRAASSAGASASIVYVLAVRIP